MCRRSGDTAECRFLATSLPGNWPVFPDARQGSFAMAYGRVTIDTSLTGAARSPYEGMTMSGFTPPTFPVLGRYRSRLAWVAVVAHLDVYSCGIQGVRKPATSCHSVHGVQGRGVRRAHRRRRPRLPARRSRWVSSARVGRGVEPAEMRVSVPWTLMGHSQRTATATVTAETQSCDGWFDTTHPDTASSRVVRVIVYRPVTASCDTQRRVDVTVQPMPSGGSLPATIQHAPTGPYLSLSP